jgi:hypothetical protein
MSSLFSFREEVRAYASSFFLHFLNEGKDHVEAGGKWWGL